MLNAFPWRRAPRPKPVPLVMYTKPGCCLCDEMKAQLPKARTGRDWTLDEVDIERDAELFERFRHSIPVLAIGGHIAFKGRLTVADFERKFARLAAEWDARAEQGASAQPEVEG